MKRVRNWWAAHFLQAELGAALAGALFFSAWIWIFDGVEIVDDLLRGNRAELYGVLASIFGALLGFVMATASIVLGFSTSDRLAVGRGSKHYRTLWRVFTSSIRTLGLATAIAVIGLIVDRDTDPQSVVLVVCVFTTLLATARLARSVWVLERVIELVTAPSKARAGADP